MKRMFALILAVCMMLCGCQAMGGKQTVSSTEPKYFAPTTAAFETQAAAQPEAATQAGGDAGAVTPTELVTEPETEPETEPVTEPEPIRYFNPLNGEELDAPFDRRIFAVSINNLRDAVPHTGVNNADMYFESFVNGSIIRGLALFTDPRGVDAIGPVRSNRLMFNDIVTHYDCIMVHAGGSWQVVENCSARGIDNYNIDSWGVMDITSFRDQERYKSGYGWEHCLYAIGDGIVQYAEQNDIRTEMIPTMDYGMTFADDGTPEGGETAENITVTITVNQYKKDTSMIYDAGLNKYVYNQYEKAMVDGKTGEPEAFRNVLILTGTIFYDGPFQRLNMLEGGTGWYACGGKAIPIKWGSYEEDTPLWFRTMDDQPLVLGKGNTYVAITQTGSKITGIPSAETV